MTKLRVLVLIDQLYSPDGGTEQQLVGLLAGLDRERFTPELLVLRRLSSFVDSPALPERTTCLGVKGAGRPGYWRAVGGIAQRLRSGHHDLLHTFFPESVTMGPYLAAVSGVPHVTSRRDLGYWYTPAKLALLRSGRRFTRRFLANSESVRESVARREGIPTGRIEVITNAVDTTLLEAVEPVDIHAELGLEPDTMTMVLPANLRPVKGVELALHALAGLNRQGLRTHLVNIGENSALLQEYRDMCEGLGIPDRVSFLGHLPRSETLRWSAGADVVLNTSLSEGLSNAVLEAMALGRPVVATAVGGNRELVRDGETGLLVPSGNREALTNALARLCRDPELARGMGRRGAEVVRGSHEPRKVVRRYEEIYRETVEEGNRS